MEDLTNLIKEDIIKTYNIKHLLYYNKNSHQNIANFLNQDAKNITEQFYLNINILVRDITRYIITSIILINKSLILYSITFLIGLIQLSIGYLYNINFFDKILNKSNIISLKINNIINDYIQKIDIYKTLNINIYDKWKNKNNIYSNLKKKECKYKAIKILIFQSINEILIILLLLIGLFLKIDYKILFIFISYKDILFTFQNNINDARLSLIKNKTSLKNIYNFFNDKSNLIINGTYIPTKIYNNIIPIININKLTFCYEIDNRKYLIILI